MFECPVLDWSCPYFDKKTEKCTMKECGDGDPRRECDAFAWVDYDDYDEWEVE